MRFGSQYIGASFNSACAPLAAMYTPCCGSLANVFICDLLLASSRVTYVAEQPPSFCAD